MSDGTSNWPGSQHAAQTVIEAIDTDGYAVIKKVLTPGSCREVADLYDRKQAFRSRIVMERHGFGQGEYQYLAYPLPKTLEALRAAIYAPLATLANTWMTRLGNTALYPATLAEFLAMCWEAGQKRPTPLILRYHKGNFNRLHQDLYGEIYFPIQLAILLNEPGQDFDGGEFILTESRPRMQTRATVVPLEQGDGVLFAVNHRPVKGSRGYYRAQMRHGVSTVTRGQRHTLGIIFHDAK